MDERAEIWIARDPETNGESRAVSLRKLRKGVKIGRLAPSILVKRVDATEWVTIERLLADAEVMSKTPPPVQVSNARDVPAREPPRPAERTAELPPVVVSPSIVPPPVAPSPEATDEITEVEEIGQTAIPPDPAPYRATALADASADRLAYHQVPPIAPADDEGALTTQWFTQSLIPPELDDDEPIFPNRSLLDVNFDHVMTTRFVKLAWVMLIASLSLAVLAAVIHAAATVLGGDAARAASAVALVPVVVLACAVVGAFGRMVLEVLLAVFRIADLLTAVSKNVARP